MIVRHVAVLVIDQIVRLAALIVIVRHVAVLVIDQIVRLAVLTVTDHLVHRVVTTVIAGPTLAPTHSAAQMM